MKLENKTIAELRQIAKDNDISMESGIKKKDLMELCILVREHTD